MQKGVGYIRESVFDGDEMSPIVQEEKIRLQAKLKGVHLADLYQDLGISGSTDKRPGFQEMLRPEILKKIDYILVYRLDRFSRSVTDFHNYLSLLEKYDVELISITENLDTSSVAGRLLRNILIAFAQYERETIAERVTDGMYKHVQQGHWNGGQVPFGFDAVKQDGDTILVPNDDARKVKDIFDMARKGIGGTVIGRKYGVHPNSIRYILRNPLYIAKYRYGGNLYDAKISQIIDKDVFDDVQAILAVRSEAAPRTTDSRHLLSGLIKCPVCGKSVTIRYTGNKKIIRRYCCPNRYDPSIGCSTRLIDADSVEEAIVQQLFKIADDKVVLDNIKKKASESLNFNQQEVKSEYKEIEVQLKDVRKAMKDMFGLFRLGKITAEQLEMMNIDYLAEEKALQERLDELKAIISLESSVKGELSEVERIAKEFKKNWDFLSDDEKRRGVKVLIKSIVVKGDKLLIEPYGISVSPKSSTKTTLTF